MRVVVTVHEFYILFEVGIDIKNFLAEYMWEFRPYYFPGFPKRRFHYCFEFVLYLLQPSFIVGNVSFFFINIFHEIRSRTCFKF